VTIFAIGDVQGCADELQALIERIGFSADRDQLWFVGDLVNRGPCSLATLRYVHALRDNVVVVLGNHDLHLLALAFGERVRVKEVDTLAEVLAAPDRERLLTWLIERPLAHFDAQRGDLLIHAGLIPQWSVADALSLAGEVEAMLRRDPGTLFRHMYGDGPERWSEELAGWERLRFTVNALTRLRMCTADGRIDLKMKGPPPTGRGLVRPWFEHAGRRSRDARIIFGHWSALGYVDAYGVIGLDTGCVWGGALTALDLEASTPPVSVACGAYQYPGDG
jgi:bis(5'-nucleosyl)-tetraphosphatase (symmetrical)